MEVDSSRKRKMKTCHSGVCVCLDAKGDVLSLHNVVHCINLPVVIYNKVSGL